MASPAKSQHRTERKAATGPCLAGIAQAHVSTHLNPAPQMSAQTCRITTVLVLEEKPGTPGKPPSPARPLCRAGRESSTDESPHQPTEANGSRDSAERWARLPFLHILPETGQIYGVSPETLTFGAALVEVERLAAIYRRAGYGHGHRAGDLVPHHLAAELEVLDNGIHQLHPC
ncbi:MAG: hypothetical protein HC767_07065 [Akkermansiaceae bacterium]|nr:hypothetical protein [Akkermansiaceae bacterium]